MTKDPRLFFDATSRNSEPILNVLRPLFRSEPCNVLEIASGSGQHAIYMTSMCPNLTLWPSDLDPDHIASIDAWRVETASKAIQPAQILDVTDDRWCSGEDIQNWPREFDAIINANMIHIAPWDAAVGLLEGASHRLTRGGLLYFYGPFKQNGSHTAPSNQAFDENLRSRNPDWGIRDVGAVEDCANQYHLALDQIIEMPANNLSLIFRKSGA